MSALLKFFSPLRHAAAAFFKHDLALRRGAGGVHIVLKERVEDADKWARPVQRNRAEEAEERQRAELKLIHEQLGALLDEQPESRQTLRHLVFVEQALKKKGLRALHKLPLDVLRRSHEQLEGLVTNWTPAGLASLRSKMAVAILDREHEQPLAESDAYRTAAVLDTGPVAQPEVEMRSDDEALAAAYAALGAAAPATIEMQPELGARSARAAVSPQARAESANAEIPLRELHG